MMPGRHAAERTAKRVWNEVVDELGSRSFFDAMLVKVHWIGLYTKRAQDLAGNAISFIQEHAGVDHSDEISATAYLREDLAAVSFTRPMVGVILRGRTTYAGAVDLGTQWSVKLKPEDIERQKGSGTRKLPWYEDEGTIADNMTVDETSWRDHVWGPQYYRTKMPELIVGSWSFDTVLIPQSVMSGAPDDMQRVIQAASELGCKVVDEHGNGYEPGEKIQITEGALRRIIREVLVKASELDPAGTERLLTYVDAADQHPEFAGYDLVKGPERDSTRLAITDDAGVVVGFMTPRFDRGFWRTGAIYTNPADRGKGFARRAIIDFFSDPAHRPARVWIADVNRQSQRAFTGAGFVKGAPRDIGPSPSDKGHDYYLDVPHREPSAESATSPY